MFGFCGGDPRERERRVVQGLDAPSGVLVPMGGVVTGGMDMSLHNTYRCRGLGGAAVRTRDETGTRLAAGTIGMSRQVQ